jgi:hypothetical protein
MIIFGTKGTSALLGVLFFVCRVCGNEAAQRLVKHRRWFTLFFIPVIPYSTKHVYTCAYCGAGTELDAEAADRFQADAEHAAASRGGRPQG